MQEVTADVPNCAVGGSFPNARRGTAPGEAIGALDGVVVTRTVGAQGMFQVDVGSTYT